MGGSNTQLMEALYLDLADTHIVPKPVSENKIQADNETKYQNSIIYLSKCITDTYERSQ